MTSLRDISMQWSGRNFAEDWVSFSFPPILKQSSFFHSFFYLAYGWTFSHYTVCITIFVMGFLCRIFHVYPSSFGTKGVMVLCPLHLNASLSQCDLQQHTCTFTRYRSWETCVYSCMLVCLCDMVTYH